MHTKKNRKKRKPAPNGTVFEKQYKGESYLMKVVHKKGVVGYFVGKHRYNSPSAAAKAITATEVNGWVFWGMDRQDEAV